MYRRSLGVTQNNTEKTTRSMNQLKIGGNEGHVEEFITGNILVLWQAPFCNWKPIRNCTGRYSCKEARSIPPSKKNSPQKCESNRFIVGHTNVPIPSEMSPEELMRLAVSASLERPPIGEENTQSKWKAQEFGPAPGRNDCIQVLPLDPERKTGIITYVKRQEHTNQPVRYVHTLNAPSGFQRKLEAVGIELL